MHYIIAMQDHNDIMLRYFAHVHEHMDNVSLHRYIHTYIHTVLHSKRVDFYHYVVFAVF